MRFSLNLLLRFSMKAASLLKFSSITKSWTPHAVPGREGPLHQQPDPPVHTDLLQEEGRRRGERGGEGGGEGRRRGRGGRRGAES